MKEITEILLIPWVISILIGLPIGILLIRFGRKHHWFSDFVTRHEYDQLIEEAFAGRPRLSPQAFFDKYFSSSGIPFHVVTGVRRVFEEQLSTDFSRIADTDDFTANLGCLWKYWDGDDAGELTMALEQEFKVKIPDAEADRMRTIRDVIGVIWNKQKEAQAQPSGGG